MPGPTMVFCWPATSWRALVRLYVSIICISCTANSPDVFNTQHYTPFTRYNRLSNWLNNRLDNRLYRVYKHSTGRTTGCITIIVQPTAGWTTDCIAYKQISNPTGSLTGYKRFYRVNGVLAYETKRYFTLMFAVCFISNYRQPSTNSCRAIVISLPSATSGRISFAGYKFNSLHIYPNSTYRNVHHNPKPTREIWPSTSDLWTWYIQGQSEQAHAKWSFHSKRHTDTHSHVGPIAQSRPLKWSVDITSLISTANIQPPSRCLIITAL